jgi:hypothetical protein
LGFKKHTNFYVKNRDKLLKIVIITSTPGKNAYVTLKNIFKNS